MREPLCQAVDCEKGSVINTTFAIRLHSGIMTPTSKWAGAFLGQPGGETCRRLSPKRARMLAACASLETSTS